MLCTDVTKTLSLEVQHCMLMLSGAQQHEQGGWGAKQQLACGSTVEVKLLPVYLQQLGAAGWHLLYWADPQQSGGSLTK